MQVLYFGIGPGTGLDGISAMLDDPTVCDNIGEGDRRIIGGTRSVKL